MRSLAFSVDLSQRSSLDYTVAKLHLGSEWSAFLKCFTFMVVSVRDFSPQFKEL